MADDVDLIVEEVGRASGPIEDHLLALATSREFPGLAIAVCTVRFDETAPVFRGLLARAANGEALGAAETQLLFAGVHILGGRRDAQSFAPLLRLLRRPMDEVEALMGDAITATLPKIAAGVFDGDADALFAAIADPSLDEFVRDSLFGAATFLTWEGRIDAARMREFLERFYRERIAEDDDYAWSGWQRAIAMLGLRDLRPLVQAAWAEGRLAEEIAEPEFFEEDLAAAERAPADIGRFREAHLGYIEDTADALSWCDWSTDADDADRDEVFDDDLLADAGWAEPAVNPWRNVGRNDPCPCGSGRKFKKCCIDVESDADV